MFCRTLRQYFVPLLHVGPALECAMNVVALNASPTAMWGRNCSIQLSPWNHFAAERIPPSRSILISTDQMWHQSRRNHSAIVGTCLALVSLSLSHIQYPVSLPTFGSCFLTVALMVGEFPW